MVPTLSEPKPSTASEVQMTDISKNPTPEGPALVHPRVNPEKVKRKFYFFLFFDNSVKPIIWA
jgi:hypothetical protein